MGDVGYEDRPLTNALLDAKVAATAATTADLATARLCRNTIVILITSGKDDGTAVYRATSDVEGTALTFANVNILGVIYKIPIHVIAVKPQAGDVAQLTNIATKSGGLYTNAQTSTDVTKAINFAVQRGFARLADFEAGTTSEFLPVSPIVGTVNLKNANNSTGGALPNTDITANPGGQALPQRSNMMITAGFSLPGFDGRLRAFRTYRPVPTRPSRRDGSSSTTARRLWPDLDGRPALAGLARVPADPTTRNIYTYMPNGAGGGSVVAFTTRRMPRRSNHTSARPAPRRPR